MVVCAVPTSKSYCFPERPRIEIVGGLQHPDTPRRLIRVIEEDAELNVCAAAVEALAECGEPEAIEPLKRLLTRFPDEPFLKFAVDTALKRIA